MMKIKFYLLIILFVLPACEKNYSPANIDDCPILFARYYINYAWGYTYDGWYVDKNGRIYEIDINSSLKLVTDHNTSLTEQQLNDLLIAANETNKYLNKDDLLKMIGLISPSSSGQLSDRVNRCYDFGGISYYTFIKDQYNNGFKSILLYSAGDWAQKNLSSEATELFDLLRQHVESDTNKLPCAP